MNLSKISLLVVPLLALSLLIGTSTAEAFGNRGGRTQGGMRGGPGFGFGPGGQSDDVTPSIRRPERDDAPTVERRIKRRGLCQETPMSSPQRPGNTPSQSDTLTCIPSRLPTLRKA